MWCGIYRPLIPLGYTFPSKAEDEFQLSTFIHGIKLLTHIPAAELHHIVNPVQQSGNSMDFGARTPFTGFFFLAESKFRGNVSYIRRMEGCRIFLTASPSSRNVLGSSIPHPLPGSSPLLCHDASQSYTKKRTLSYRRAIHSSNRTSDFLGMLFFMGSLRSCSLSPVQLHSVALWIFAIFETLLYLTTVYPAEKMSSYASLAVCPAASSPSTLPHLVPTTLSTLAALPSLRARSFVLTASTHSVNYSPLISPSTRPTNSSRRAYMGSYDIQRTQVR